MAESAEEVPEFVAKIASLDTVLQHRVRLAICVLLSGQVELSFARIKELLEETDGSLGTQFRKLEDEKYISVRKAFEGRKPITWYKLTAKGKKALREHFERMNEIATELRN